MAKQTINIGVSANDGTGDPLRSAFSKTNDNITELYNGQSISIVSDELRLTRADGTTSTVDLSSYLDEDARAIASGTLNVATGIVTFTRDDASTFTIDLSGLKDITSADGITIEYNLSSELRVKDNGISYAKLEGRFTDKQDIATTSGTINLDASSYGIFELTSALTGATTLNIQNIKKGQVIDILVTGSQTITFTDDFTTSAINKLAEADYDGANTNHIQVICIDDNDSDAILNYVVTSYTSDTTP